MNKQNGNLLIQVNIVLVCFTLIFLAFFQNYIQVVGNIRKIYEVIEMYRTKRMIAGVLEKAIAYETSTLKIFSNDYGDGLICINLSGQRKTVFYCNTRNLSEKSIGFYQAVNVIGKKAGINPLLSEVVSVEECTIKKLDGRTVKIKLILKATKGRERKEFVEVIRLCNGVIV